MSDDLGKKVQQIVQMLGQDSMPDNMKELVTMFASSLGSKDNQANQTISPEAGSTEKTESIESSVNPEVLDSAKRAVDRLNTANDPRINLLHAIKPFMNSRRQKKIGNCIQLLQVASLSKLMNNQEK